MLSLDNNPNQQWQQLSSTPPRQILGTNFADHGVMWTSQAVSNDIHITPPQPRLTHHRSLSALQRTAQQLVSPPSDTGSALSRDSFGSVDDANYLLGPGARILPRAMPPSPPPSLPSRSRTPFRISKRGRQGSVSMTPSAAASPYAARAQNGSPVRPRSQSRQRTPSRHMTHHSLNSIPIYLQDEAPPMPSQAPALQPHQQKHEQEQRLRRAVSMNAIPRRPTSQSPVRNIPTEFVPPVPPMPSASQIANALESHNASRSVSVSPQRRNNGGSSSQWPSMSPSRDRHHTRSTSLSGSTARLMGLELGPDIPPVPSVPQLPTTSTAVPDVMLGSHLLMNNTNPYMNLLGMDSFGALGSMNGKSDFEINPSTQDPFSFSDTIAPTELLLGDDLFGNTNFLSSNDVFGSTAANENNTIAATAGLPITTTAAASQSTTATAGASTLLDDFSLNSVFNFDNPAGASVFDSNFFSILEPFPGQTEEPTTEVVENSTAPIQPVSAQSYNQTLNAIDSNLLDSSVGGYGNFHLLERLDVGSENILDPTEPLPPTLNVFDSTGFDYDTGLSQGIDYFSSLGQQLSLPDSQSFQPFDFMSHSQQGKVMQPVQQNLNRGGYQQEMITQPEIQPLSRMVGQMSQTSRRTVSLKRYLCSPIPSPGVIPQPMRQTFGQKHIWFDIRNLREWTDFSMPTITATPELSKALNRAYDADRHLVSAPFTDMNPVVMTENSLAKVWSESIFWRTNRSLEVTDTSRTENSSAVTFRHLEMTRTQAVNSPDFVLNRSHDGQRTFNGKTRARVVGVVKPYAIWNTSMREGHGGEKTKYLSGLAHLHYLMRENHTRYGFIISEVELVCVRAGGPLNTAAAVNIHPDPSLMFLNQAVHDSTAPWPLFGYLELSKPISLKANKPSAPNGHSKHSSSSDDLFAPFLSSPQKLPTEMNASIALWYLGLLASDARPAGQPYWEMNVGGPAACTRQTVHPDRDDWIADLPVTISDRRAAKNARVWVWPTDKPTPKEAKGSRGRFGLF